MRKPLLCILFVLVSLLYGLLARGLELFPYSVVRGLENRIAALREPVPQPPPEEPSWPAAPTWFSPPSDSPSFEGLYTDTGPDVFDVVAADMDLDGDLDLFVNYHHLFPSKLFENRGDRFELVSVPGADRSGVFDNPGIPDLFAEEEAMVAAIRREGEPGLYVWHDLEREFGAWRFYLEADDAPVEGSVLYLRFNGPVKSVSGLRAADYLQTSPYDVEIPLSGSSSSETIGIHVDGFVAVAVELVIRWEVTAGVSLPPLFVGPQWTRATSKGLSLWKPDPHGVAWVQTRGSPEPELFLARGALRGTLAPPHEPKSDLFYSWQGEDEALYRQEEVIPPNYGRGRRVEWVDVDNDSINELYVGNARSPNNLLVLDPETGRYHDRASRFGLGFLSGAIFAWMDWDEDGFQDLIFLSGERLALARNIGGARFDVLNGRDLGLTLPEVPPGTPRAFFDPRALHLLDFDDDGRLDLWVSGCEPGWANRLFRRQEGGFGDVTRKAGLAPISDSHRLLIVDVDSDGFADAVSIGQRVVLLRNVKGRYFVPSYLDVGNREVFNATAGDFDGDGLVDLALVGRAPYLALNQGNQGNGSIRVELGPALSEPLGALVSAHFEDGTMQVQRYGSSRNSAFSQALQPLHFGIAQGVSLTSIGVRWPGSTVEVLYPVAPGQTTLQLRRPDSTVQ